MIRFEWQLEQNCYENDGDFHRCRFERVGRAAESGAACGGTGYEHAVDRASGALSTADFVFKSATSQPTHGNQHAHAVD
jgi:hypothetical protein